MQPIWQYQSKLRMNSTNNHISIKKKDGTECQGMGETLERWEEWTKECFIKEQKSLTPNIEHIRGPEWGKPFTQTSANLQEIRKHSMLTQMMENRPEIETWLNQDYTEQNIDVVLRNLALRKSHGNDGVPGEEYKSTAMWAITPITKITNLIKMEDPYQKNGQKEQ